MLVAPRFDVYEGTNKTSSIEYSAIKSGLGPGGVFDNQPQLFADAYNSYEMTKGMLNPQDLIGAPIFILSDESAFVNGQNIVVDNGWTL